MTTPREADRQLVEELRQLYTEQVGAPSHDTFTVEMEVTHQAGFAFHFEEDGLVIDHCEGMTPAQGLSLFDDWILEGLAESALRKDIDGKHI